MDMDAAASMQTSEEVCQINSALIHCTQLKTQLQGTLLHIQRLNTQYNQTDYMAVIRNMENYRKSTVSPYPKVRQRDQSAGESNSHQCSTPAKRPTMFRRRQLNVTSTPNQCAQLDKTFDLSHSDLDTPKRSVREMKNSNNTINVRTIKVQRNIEAIIAQLQVLQKSHKKRHQHHLEQSLFQNCSNTSIGSPGQLGHMHCLEHRIASLGSSFGSNDSLHNHSGSNTPKNHKRALQSNEDQKTLDRVKRFYATPLQRMHKRLTHLNASLVSTC